MGLGFVEELIMGGFRSIIIPSVVLVNLVCSSIICNRELRPTSYHLRYKDIN